MTSAPSSSGESFVSTLLTAVKEDLDSPVTSNFGSRINECRTQVQTIADEVEGDVVYLDRMRKITREIESVLNSFSKHLSSLGAAAKELAEKWAARGAEAESDGAAALLKMELFLRKESDLINDQVRNWSNNVSHPLEVLIKFSNELRNKGVDKACRDYDFKFLKAEGEAKKHAKQSGYTRSQVSHRELAEELTNERLLVEHELCKFLLVMGTVEDKKSAQLVRHFLELFRSQYDYCMERARISDHFRCDFATLDKRMEARNAANCQQRNALFDLKTRLESNHEIFRPTTSRRGRTDSHSRGSRLSVVDMYGGTSSSSLVVGPFAGMENEALAEAASGVSNISSDPYLLVGWLYKKSNKKLHKQWQKRRCKIQDGCFWLSHSDETLAPAQLSLLVSDCKPSPEGSRMFDLYCRDRTYHLQAETEIDAKKWVIALRQEISRLKNELLNTGSSSEEMNVRGRTTGEWSDWKKCVAAVRNLPGNRECADCSSSDDVQWLSNTGALVCIACSGVHRELGVHVSRIQSLDLDVISPVEFLIPLSTGNLIINRVYESDEKACNLWKPRSGCSRSDRQKFIQLKYRDKAFIQKFDDADSLFFEAMRELNFEKAYKALLCPNITGAPFAEQGPFYELIRQNNPLALPFIQLVAQLGISLPGLEMMLAECVQTGNIDGLYILLHNRSGDDNQEGIRLKMLYNLALKLGVSDAAEAVKMAQSSGRALLSQITIPSCLIVSTSSSGSPSQSSSVSPLARPSPEVNLGSSSPVNVLMRNGTTIAVAKDASVSDRRSVSPADNRLRPSSTQVYSCSTYPLPASISSFKGTTFGKCLNEFTQQTAVHFPTEPGSSKQSTSVITDQGVSYLNPTSSSNASPKAVLSSGDTVLRLGNAGTSNSVMPQQSGVNAGRIMTHVAATPNYYSKAPGSLKLSTGRGKSNPTFSVDKETSSTSSVPSSPVPVLPNQPKPKVYHRSASEYNQAVPNVGALRELHEQKVSSAYMRKNIPTGPFGDRLKSSSGMSASFSMAGSSVSLDPIPSTQSSRKDDKCSSMLLKEKTFVAEDIVIAKKEGFPSTKEPSDVSADLEKKRVLTSFDSARASFMTPGDSSRFSTMNRFGRNEVSSVTEVKKVCSFDVPSVERTAGSLKNSRSMIGSNSVKLKPPVPTPRRSMGSGDSSQREYIRRCRALYDCTADNPDELSFKQGDIVIISKEHIAGENDTWMEGYLARDPEKRGIFPITFVTFQS